MWVRIPLPPPPPAETLVKAGIVSAGYDGHSPPRRQRRLDSDNKTYIGCTDNLDDRLKRHQSGWVPSTKNRLPLVLQAYIAFEDKYKAFKFEKYLKSGSGRAFLKKRLI